MAIDGGSRIERSSKRFAKLLEEANGSLVSDFWRCRKDKGSILFGQQQVEM
jgi:hypothetical protein